MSKCTSELSDLFINGPTISYKKVNLELRLVVCDAPARAFVTGTPGHPVTVVQNVFRLVAK